MSSPAQQSQIAADNAQLKKLISELPISDGAIPINDQTGANGELIKGVHGAATNQTESEIAGITKRYIVSSVLQEAGKPSANMDGFLDAIKQVVTSRDAAELAPKSEQEEKERVTKKIEALGFNDDTKAVVTAIVNNQVTDETKQKVASSAFQESLPSGNLHAVVDETVQQLAQAHHYQISSEGNLHNLSSVRNGLVAGRSPHAGPDSLQSTFNAQSDDVDNKKKSVDAFLSNVGKEWFEGKSEINIYDIGYGGKPEAAIAAVKAIKAINPDIVINYTGVDLATNPDKEKLAKESLQAVGVNSVTLEAGRFGLAELDASVAQHKGKMDLVLGTHVYNLGERTDGVPTTFLRQVDELMSPDALSIIQHASGESWINDIRKANPDKLRGGPGGIADGIAEGLKKSEQEFSSFGSPTTIKFYAGEDPSNTLFKDKYLDAIADMPVGKFDAKTREDVMQKSGITTDAEKAEFKTLTNLLEFYMSSPLESFTAQNRLAIVGEIKQEADKQKGQVVEYTEVQVLPKSKERLALVEQAVEATKAQLEPASVETSQTVTLRPQQQQPAEPAAPQWQPQIEQQHIGSNVYVAPRGAGRGR